MRRQSKAIGLAIIGAGRVGLFRGEVAARHPAVQYRRIPPGTNIWHAIAAAARGNGSPLWLVVARNSLTFDTGGVPDGWRLEEIALEPPRPDRIRLLRVFKTP